MVAKIRKIEATPTYGFTSPMKKVVGIDRVDWEAAMEQEQRSLMLTGDFFKRIIITKDTPAPYYNENGVLIMSVYDFLLDENSLDI